MDARKPSELGHGTARDEPALIQSARDGSADAAEVLVRRYWGQAYRVAWLILHDVHNAEDAAQEALVSALGALARFDVERPFGAWVARISANKAYDIARGNARRPEVVGDVSESDATTADQMADEVADRLIPAELAAAVANLDPDQRVVLVLRHVLGYTPAEIAEELGIPSATVRTRLHRALARLRERLPAQEGATGEQAR
jgi:RNA polymerase sigma-70 factor, ECF subfamily